jgi:hypothetical protein
MIRINLNYEGNLRDVFNLYPCTNSTAVTSDTTAIYPLSQSYQQNGLSMNS